MKKILSLFIILGAITFINVDLFAYTFNGSYDFSNIDLNQSLSELNGASLNDLFDYEYLNNIPLNEINGKRNKFELVNGVIQFSEYLYYNEIYIDFSDINGNNNLITNGDFSNGTTGWIADGNETVSNNILTAYGNGGSDLWIDIFYSSAIPYSQNDKLFIYLKSYMTTTIYNKSIKLQDGSNNYYINDNTQNVWSEMYGIIELVNTPVNNLLTFSTYAKYADTTNLEYKLDGNTGVYVINMTELGIEFYTEENMLDLINGQSTIVIEEYSTPIQNSDLTQSLYYYNLENINIDLLNYYFAIFLLNKYQLPVSDLWIYAYTAGYEEGNLQGYSDGYDEGLFDYHTGNYYGQYDYTLSEPYDQATQANISLLSVFSLIIGVVMSMLGFIINIEMFGISIASILGTLAIGVSIIWLLKLIRG
jgi:hypothetical protein